MCLFLIDSNLNRRRALPNQKRQNLDFVVCAALDQKNRGLANTHATHAPAYLVDPLFFMRPNHLHLFTLPLSMALLHYAPAFACASPVLLCIVFSSRVASAIRHNTTNPPQLLSSVTYTSYASSISIKQTPRVVKLFTVHFPPSALISFRRITLDMMSTTLRIANGLHHRPALHRRPQQPAAAMRGRGRFTRAAASNKDAAQPRASETQQSQQQQQQSQQEYYAGLLTRDLKETNGASASDILKRSLQLAGACGDRAEASSLQLLCGGNVWGSLHYWQTCMCPTRQRPFHTTSLILSGRQVVSAACSSSSCSASWRQMDCSR